MKPILTIKVPSKTTPGDYHDVVFFDNGEIECSCVRWKLYHMHCSHIDLAKERLKKEGLDKFKKV